ncbi:hypothetical protein [Methylobacterium sp. WSM2598]|uniref:hypothetical protein n=1 Tax=Methylobacterium sp. WSM2598 TaxID=398261 RepID=UPI0012F695C2|nr:hypothetical protein [Methylobacterium sp. WSM2598]
MRDNAPPRPRAALIRDPGRILIAVDARETAIRHGCHENRDRVGCDPIPAVAPAQQPRASGTREIGLGRRRDAETEPGGTRET